MSFVYYNPNPDGRLVGDCTVRAICRLTDQEWDPVYVGITFEGFIWKDMPSGNNTWGAYLYRKGYIRKFAPYGYTVKDFCREHPKGRYLLVLDNHVVTAVDGDYYDIWDSGNELLIYYWTKEEE